MNTDYLSNFSGALAALYDGCRVARQGWNGKGQNLGLQRPDANSANSLPYIFIITVTGDRVPWVASQTDLLAQDWFIASQPLNSAIPSQPGQQQ